MRDVTKHAADLIIGVVEEHVGLGHSAAAYLSIHLLQATGMHPHDVTPEIARAIVQLTIDDAWRDAPHVMLTHDWSKVWAHCAQRL